MDIRIYDSPGADAEPLWRNLKRVEVQEGPSENPLVSKPFEYRQSLADTCPCWTDPELSARDLYCPACTAEIEASNDE